MCTRSQGMAGTRLGTYHEYDVRDVYKMSKKQLMEALKFTRQSTQGSKSELRERMLWYRDICEIPSDVESGTASEEEESDDDGESFKVSVRFSNISKGLRDQMPHSYMWLLSEHICAFSFIYVVDIYLKVVYICCTAEHICAIFAHICYHVPAYNNNIYEPKSNIYGRTYML